MIEHDIWGKKEGLENVKEMVAEFEGRINAEIKR